MFDRHYHIQDNRSVLKAARINAESQEKFVEQLKTISEAEIKSKDRVDITLTEYERLKDNTRKYEERCRKMGAMIMRLGIPDKVIDLIDNESIEVFTSEDPIRFKTHYQIRFTADHYGMKGL